MRITYLVHGFVPYENAGTEQHCALLREYFIREGHQVQVISATRAIGKLHGHTFKEGSINPILRIVNNIPSRPLEQCEVDANITEIVEQAIEEFQPDVVHVHHIQFLSSNIRFTQPSLFTFHDAWMWCPSGGTLFRYPHLKACSNPTPKDCAHCYAHWRPQPSSVGNILIQLAQYLQPLISSRRLHQLWKKIPSIIRKPIAQEKQQPKLESEKALQKRNQAMNNFLKQINILISPSNFLAESVRKQFNRQVTVIRHGVEDKRPHIGGNGLVYIGTMAHHKGVTIIEEAYLLAFPQKEIAICFYGTGPVSVNLPVGGPLTRAEVLNALQHADALVMGSLWYENAPMIISEARAMGCPIIAPNIGGIPELIEDGLDGLLYPAGDTIALAQAMKVILMRTWQPTVPTSMTEMMTTYTNLYHQLCTKSEP